MAERVIIGTVVGIHGIKGEVRVLPWTDDPGRFSQLKVVVACYGGSERKMHVASARTHKNIVILSFKDINSANEAEKLRNWTIEIDKKDLLPLPEGRYYIFDLIGLRVRTLAGENLGVLTEVLQTGANDVYVVRSDDAREVLLPALKSVVKKVDIIQGEMLVDPLPGLLD